MADDVTTLLMAWAEGSDAAFERLLPMVQTELHRIAKAYMQGERAGHSLQATALVNEAYLRLVDSRRVRWQDRAHFLAMSARLMRRVLVDHARSRGYQKRGGGAIRVTLAEDVALEARDEDVIALDDAIQALATVDPRKAQVVEMRFFGGLSVEEAAGVLNVSPETVKRDWRYAKAWLLRRLRA